MDQATMRALALVAGLGFAIAIPLGLFFAAGLWLDARLSTRPLFMLIGILLGLIVAGFTIAELLKFRRSDANQPTKRSKRAVPDERDNATKTSREG